MDLTTREGRREQGRRIQRAAEEVGLSLEDLAREIGCSRALIYQYVSGGVPAQPARLQKIAQRTGQPLTFFYETVSGEPAEGAAMPSEAPREDLSDRPIHRQDGTTPPGLRGHGQLMSDREVEASAPRSQITPLELDPEIEVARIALPYLEELADTQEAYADTRGLVASCERIVPFARELHDREAEARAWLRIGNARIQRGHHDLAIPALQLALSLFERLGNTRLALSCHQSMGNSRLSLGDLAGARAEFQLVADGPAWMNRWQGMVSLAAVFEQQGAYQEALAHCEAALEIVASETSEPRASVEAARCYVISNQANVYLACGDFPHAAQLSRELGRSAERVNQRDQFTESLINLGICHIYSGEWDTAQEEFSRATDLARFSDDRPRWGFARAWHASLLCLLGSPEEAKAEAKDALRLGVETSDRRCEVQAHLALAEAYLQANAPRESLYHAEQAVSGAAMSFNISQEMLARLHRGAALLAMGEADAALSEMEKVLIDSATHGLRHLEAISRDAKARILADRGEPDVSDARSAIQEARLLGMTDLEWRAGELSARILETRGEIETAIEEASKAIERVQHLRARILSCCEAESFLDDAVAFQLFRRQVERLRHTGRFGEASTLLDESRWPPLSAWFDRGLEADVPGEAHHA